MRLFLASSLDQVISKLDENLDKRNKSKVLFIPNAADVYDDKWWVDLDRKAFFEHGYDVVEKDLEKISKDELIDAVREAEIVHICGGSVFHILSLLKKNDFLGIIKKAVVSEEVVYTGTSAGSIIAAERVGLYLYDKEEEKFLKGSADFTAFGFVNFLIIPHAESEDFVESNKEMIGNAKNTELPIVVLRDNRAVWVEDDRIKFVSA